MSKIAVMIAKCARKTARRDRFLAKLKGGSGTEILGPLGLESFKGKKLVEDPHVLLMEYYCNAKQGDVRHVG